MPDDLLRKYRPVGPPADLRARILVPERAAWPWAVAAAALLVATLGLQLAIDSMAVRAIEVTVAPFDFEARVSQLTVALGGGEDARRRATLLAVDEDIRMRLPAPAGMAVPGEVR